MVMTAAPTGQARLSSTTLGPKDGSRRFTWRESLSFYRFSNTRQRKSSFLKASSSASELGKPPPSCAAIGQEGCQSSLYPPLLFFHRFILWRHLQAVLGTPPMEKTHSLARFFVAPLAGQVLEGSCWC